MKSFFSPLKEAYKKKVKETATDVDDKGSLILSAIINAISIKNNTTVDIVFLEKSPNKFVLLKSVFP